jgi:hypothetical protein
MAITMTRLTKLALVAVASLCVAGDVHAQSTLRQVSITARLEPAIAFHVK